ncbi:MAG: hypothetical protein LUE17_11265 [Planctomycetaceae bacterium]|nr:hypothetical protein [Planctomycetaceae bacterium]
MHYTTLAIDFVPDRQDLLRRLSLDETSEEAEDFFALLDRLTPVGKPKAAVLHATVDVADPETGRVVVGGVEFSSTLLAGHLKDQTEAWPHLATCGRELYDAVQAIPDPFERYWGEEILEAALAQARAAMLQHLEKEHHVGKIASMGPGSLIEWPISQQEPLFRLMAEGVAFTGIELTKTMLMLPNKSISGILFKSEKDWESCVLCPRQKCPNRRAEYDPDFAMAH